MVQTIPARNLTLGDLIDKFNLQRATDEQFFTEWLTDLPQLSEVEKQTLDRVKNNYLYLIERYSMSESIVKMVVLSPLLDLAGFYQPPYRVEGEPSVEIVVENEGEIVRGQIDVLVLHHQLWILVVESKRNTASIEVGIPQALAYMLGNPNREKPTFGLVTNGTSFMFLKLTKQGTPQYARSDQFSIFRQDNELYTVVSILKRLGNLLLQ
ncbi:MAG: restriction endonuclease subunit R [Crinalium sp.]